MDALPRCLTSLTRAGGVIKADYEDFHVTEEPLYPPSGTGTHTYFVVEKRGLTTMQAVQDIAAALNLRRRDIGVAGLKDARAVTRQWMSVEHVPAEALLALRLARVRILECAQHGNKLRIGHLRGNRFRIRVRQAPTQRVHELRAALDQLVRNGVPNYFGPQRFGSRGDTWKIGRAIVRENLDEALDYLAGKPGDADFGDVRRARQLYEDGKFDDALRAWPRMYRDQRLALKALVRSGGKKKKRGMLAVDERFRLFCVSAYQAHLFNLVLAERTPRGLRELLPGDLAMIHASGSVFSVEDVEREQPRADAFEISPSGPIFGYRTTMPSGVPLEIEQRTMAGESLTPDAFHTKFLRVKGSRRALRFRPLDAEIDVGKDERGSYLQLSFLLPAGCYATSLLRELFADAHSADGEDEEASNEDA